MQIKAIIFDFFGVFVRDPFKIWADRVLTDEQRRQIREGVMVDVDLNRINETEFFEALYFKNPTSLRSDLERLCVLE